MTPHPWRAIAAFVGLAYCISWILWSPLWLPAFGVMGLPILPFHHALGAFGPFIAAFVVVATTEGRRSATDLARRIVHPGPRLLVLLIALGAPLLLMVVGVGMAMALGEAVDLATIGRSAEFPAFSALMFFVYNLVSFGIGEETGWRGYLLPRLQKRCNPLTATALVTVVWAVWHAPLFLYRPGYVSMDVAGAAGWLLSLATGAVLTTVLFNASRGSVLVVAVFHATIDVAFTGTASSTVATNVSGALITIAGVAAVFLLGPRDLARDGRTMLPDDNAAPLTGVHE